MTEEEERREVLFIFPHLVGCLGLLNESSLDTSEAVPSSWFSMHLDASGLHTLYWTVDYDSQRISMELHSKLPVGSWLALGFSDRGDVSNADFCVAWTDSQNMSRFQDTWTDKNGVIHIDDQQDWTYKGYREHNITVSVFSRKLDTCDEHDKIIEEGTMRIVWATGPGPIASPEGLDTSKAHHGTASVRLLRPPVPTLTPDVWSLDILHHNFKVPSAENTYRCKIFRLPEIFMQKHHLVKYDTVVMPGNERLVHHVLLRNCKTSFSLEEGNCVRGFRKACPLVFAIGMKNFSFPEETGFVLGGPGSSMYIVLEAHYTPYDNKERVDNSGIRIYVTSRLRQYNAEIVEFGSVHLGDIALPPGQPRFQVTSHCIPSCTAISLPPDGITIFAAILHAHEKGLGMVTRHVRGGVELPEVVRDNHYDSNHQENWLLRRKVKVLPGDELITTCWFDTTKLFNTTLMGTKTSDEMCLVVAYYYPTISLSICKTSIHEHHLNEYFHRTNGDGLMKMKGVYESNPSMGDPMTIEGQLNASSHNLEKLRQELHKYQGYLDEVEGGSPANRRHNNTANNVNGLQRQHRNSGGSGGEEESLSRSASDSSVANHNHKSAPGTPLPQHGCSNSPESGLGTSHTSLPGSDDAQPTEYYDVELLPPLGTCRALYPFEATSEGSIPMSDGEELLIIEHDQGDGWTRVRRTNDSEEGFVPTSYIECTVISSC